MNRRVKLENLAFKKEIKQSHEKRSETLAELLLSNDSLNKIELNIIARNLNIKKPHKLSLNSLINLFRQFLVTKKLDNLGLNKLLKRYVSLNELDPIQKLNELSHKSLKELGELQRIRNYDLLSKEDIIYSLLRSINANEDNYISSITSDLDTSILDNEIKAKIGEIKQLVTRLGNLLSNKEKNKIRKELYELLKKLNNTKLRKNEKKAYD